MKRIGTIILSVSLSVSISAQDRTPMDKIWEDIEKIISNRQDSKMKINHGDGQLLYVHNGIVHLKKSKRPTKRTAKSSTASSVPSDISLTH